MSQDALSCKDKTEYVRKLRERLHYAYQKAREETDKSAKEHKRYYDLNARSSVLHPGDHVLVRNVGLRGKQKLADRWESQPYVVCRQPNEDIPVYVVRPDNSRSRKTRTLHRNLLLPFMSILDWHSEEENLDAEEGQADVHSVVSVTSMPSDAEITSDTEGSSVESAPPSPRYRIPQRRPPGTVGVLPRSTDLPTSISMTSNDWVFVVTCMSDVCARLHPETFFCD